MKAWMSGNVAGTGTFRCTDCDYPVSLDAVDELPTCPNCGGTEFVRASLFTTAQTSVVEMATDVDDHSWLEDLRESLSEIEEELVQTRWKSSRDALTAPSKLNVRLATLLGTSGPWW